MRPKKKKKKYVYMGAPSVACIYIYSYNPISMIQEISRLLEEVHTCGTDDSL